ncbi:hypothetical protein A3A71_04260 [Candidatus Berkelbacteria bacterium RIFCSPLOWO2_01_FULL_50_28]|uniref:Polymerase nucleotidyl transferase domain-containing protein n=1 Tax=Candidatus Berkelbacteria bacterium RIFCSPLOWO2_01_FULL_50_28 TaxID=1797471 RepID=A0A1F5EAE2_9BACT|nr:MAG: hypothetical protein A2807_03350 [Candidatus Berkelbacteria bacterium RIFCSPHIGHO2_01_FULL_50_36]OGD62435.1 MAG: hypothetical protein A3F39_01885 [Candidatus Berkelbacteria bacterium RIFCSPHIGHO2_12_FULL_50_11]OGD64345.1 MAG: hypothetical protein A3A71_04260 [Candidatus Berkelbacteria bacterium RIFCSPLOWO2_01_FULL_50_28]
MEVMELSKRWKERADEILATTKLTESISNLGKVVFTGSYELDLMMSGDIDLYLLSNENPKELAPKVIARLLKSDFWNYYTIHDWLHFEDPRFPRSYYIGLNRKDDNGEAWKVDIWLFNELPKEITDYFRWLKASLTQESRARILGLKQDVKQSSTDISSTRIYDAVINHGVATIEELKSHIRNNPTWDSGNLRK